MNNTNKLTISDIQEHLRRPEIKEIIQGWHNTNGFHSGGSQKIKGWYKYNGDERYLLDICNDEDYNLMIDTYEEAFYGTTNRFQPTVWTESQKRINGEWDNSNPIGSFADTEYYTPFFDIDLLPQYKLVNPPNKAIKSLEKAAKFVYDDLMDYLTIKTNISVLFSVGGVYVFLHPKLFKFKKEMTAQERFEAWQLLTDKFEMYIEDVEQRFFEENPDCKNYISFDKALPTKKLHKTIFSPHKNIPAIVIPLQAPKFNIDIEDAQLPINDDMIELGRDMLEFTSDEDGLKALKDKLMLYEKNVKQRRMTRKESVGDKVRCKTQIPIDLINKHSSGFWKALTRPEGWDNKRSSILQAIVPTLDSMGWLFEDIDDYIYNLSRTFATKSDRRSKILDLMNLNPPSYETLYNNSIGYPRGGLSDFKDQFPSIPKMAKDEVRYILKNILNDFKKHGYVAKMDNITVSIRRAKGNKFNYTIYKDGDLLRTFDGKETPTSVGDKSDIFKVIKEHIRSNKSDKEVNQSIRNDLDSQIKLRNNLLQFQEDYIDYLKRFKNTTSLEESIDILKEHDNILALIGTISDYHAAGERGNVLFAFTGHLSTIFLEKDPVNMYATGDSGMGKGYVINTSLKLIPPEHIFKDKHGSVAAVYRQSTKDEMFFDKKVIYMGDMGGSKEFEQTEPTRNVYKELNSDGEVSKTVVDLESMEAYELHLKGYPSLTYTTVNPDKIDDQEKSRGFVITPRLDNGKMVAEFTKSMKHGGYSKQVQERFNVDLLPKIHNAILYIKEKNYGVINPYQDEIEAWIMKSPFAKRHLDKILTLANVITLINHIHRHGIKINERKFVITAPHDIMYLKEIMQEYISSIVNNLDPSLEKVYKTLYAMEDVQGKWLKSRELAEMLRSGDFQGASSNKTIKRKLDELYELGFMEKEKDGDKVTHIYKIGDIKNIMLDMPKFNSNDNDLKRIEIEHGKDVVELIKGIEIDLSPKSIHEWCISDVNKPRWEEMEPNGEIKLIKFKGNLQRVKEQIEESNPKSD